MELKTQQIGKYRIFTDGNLLRIRYVYSWVDFITTCMYVVGLGVGGLLAWIGLTLLRKDSSFSVAYFMVPVGFGLMAYFGKMLVLGFYNPRSGIFSMNRSLDQVVIRDFWKKEIFALKEIRGFCVKMVRQRKPKQVFGMFTMQLKGKADVDCFIVRGENAVVEHKAEQEIQKTGRELSRILNRLLIPKKNT